MNAILYLVRCVCCWRVRVRWCFVCLFVFCWFFRPLTSAPPVIHRVPAFTRAGGQPDPPTPFFFFCVLLVLGKKISVFFRPFFRRFPTGRLESNFVFPPSCNEIPRCRFFFSFFDFFWFRSPTTRSSQRSMAALEIGGQTSGRPDAGPISSQVSISFRFLISNLFLFILKCDFTRGFPCVTTSQYNNVKENIRVKK